MIQTPSARRAHHTGLAIDIALKLDALARARPDTGAALDVRRMGIEFVGLDPEDIGPFDAGRTVRSATD
ncbi:MAG: hypothetical protein EBS42_06965 [Caulobacteraceae bacterium]|nr:hypothetical protein [Caulobacteraceae bacterium]